MTNYIGKRDSHTLPGGEIIYLSKEPEGQWKIIYYECRQHVRIAGPSGGLYFEYLKCLPRSWKDKLFDTSDAAIDFVQQEIKEGNLPANSKD